MIGVTWSRQYTWVPEGARPPNLADDMLGELTRPRQIFATRREAEAFIAGELRKCRSRGRNSEQGYWWGLGYGRRGVRVRFEIYDEPGSSAIFTTAYPFAPPI